MEELCIEPSAAREKTDEISADELKSFSCKVNKLFIRCGQMVLTQFYKVFNISVGKMMKISKQRKKTGDR